MLPAAALLITAIGAAFVAIKVTGKNFSSSSSFMPQSSKKDNLQRQVTRILTAEGWRNSVIKLLKAKIGGASGIPVNSETGKYIILYWAGQSCENPATPGVAYYRNLGDILQPYIFDKITSGNAGEWGLSNFQLSDFTFPGIDAVTIDEGNDFGLRRNTGTWLEENFNVSCLVGVIAGAAVTVATGGTLAAPALAASAAGCRLS